MWKSYVTWSPTLNQCNVFELIYLNLISIFSDFFWFFWEFKNFLLKMKDTSHTTWCGILHVVVLTFSDFSSHLVAKSDENSVRYDQKTDFKVRSCDIKSYPIGLKFLMHNNMTYSTLPTKFQFSHVIADHRRTIFSLWKNHNRYK